MHKYILITGLMGSGKSTIIREYIIEHPVEEFTPPPVEAKFRGMDFEFIDQIFAINQNGTNYNFYELDAPTVNRWIQFIQVADAIVIVFNYQKSDYYESPKEFVTSIINNSDPSIPIWFVVTNCDGDRKSAEKRLNKLLKLKRFSKYNWELEIIKPGKTYFSNDYGARIEIDVEQLDSIYHQIIGKIAQNSD